MLESKKNNCFHCQKSITVKWVRSSRDYSKKNNWGYWTQNKDYEELYVCNDCLIKLYRQHKWEFKRLISDQKRKLLRQYILSGTISGNDKNVFIANQSIFSSSAESAKKKKKNS